MPAGAPGQVPNPNGKTSGENPDFTSYNQHVFKIFGQQAPTMAEGSSPTETVNFQHLPTETQRTTSSNASHGTGDSGEANQEENNNTKDVVIEMCNSVIMGSETT